MEKPKIDPRWEFVAPRKIGEWVEIGLDGHGRTVWLNVKTGRYFVGEVN